MRRSHPLLLAASLLAACNASGAAERSPRADDDGDRRAYENWRRPDVLVRETGLRPGMQVADVGAGGGFLEPHLAAAIQPGGRLVATDIDAAALDRLRERAAAAGIEVDVRLVAADAPGLEPGAYDRVLLAEVDHLLRDPAAYLRALAGALAPGGRIAIANRIDRRAGALAAARAAGLRIVHQSRAIPSQFIILLEPTP